jgi:signal transduction histidine kinase/CheY-like chemotaxis protein
VTITLLLASGGSEMYFGYREARENIARVQSIQAQAAAKEIEQYLRNIENALLDAAKLPWGQPGFRSAQKREEFYRLMVLYPAIMQLQDFDADGLERLFVSKSEPDRIDGLGPPGEPGLVAVSAAAPIRYGATYYGDGAEPMVRLGIASPRANRSVTVAALDLRFLADVVSGLRVGTAGQTYVVDASNRLIAHPRATQALRKLDLSSFPPVVAARRALAAGTPPAPQAVDSDAIDGQPVITTFAHARDPNWLVFIELPRSEALKPALATLTRTLVLIGLGGGVALLASALFARRMAAPIVTLRQATERIAAGDLDARIDVRTGDEIERLASDFNTMALKLREFYASLEAKVGERTAELSEARDRLEGQARQMEALHARLVEQMEELGLRKEEAERANAAKTRFLASASHDLRQPMHSISLLVSVLRDRLIDPEHISLAGKVQQSAAGMESLFTGLLDISRLDAGNVKPEFTQFPIDDILHRLEQAYGPQAAARALSLRMRRCRAVVRSDPVLLERVLANLLVNAIRYTRRGGVLLGCRRRPGAIAIQVVDTGVGVPPEHLDEIFEEFFRLGTPTGEEAKGLGLGLSIVKRSADVLGHPLRVASMVGQGSVFEVLVPRIEIDAGVAPGLPMPPAGARTMVAGAFVVIVDDDDENREALGALCTHWGCHVVLARSADEALHELDLHLRDPDLVITDYRLADGGDGFEVIAGIRRRSSGAVAAIVVTADVMPGLQRRANDVDAALLTKPAGPDRLLAAVGSALRKAREAAPDSAAPVQ